MLPFDCLQKKGRRFYRSYGGSTAHFVILSGEKCRMLKNGFGDRKDDVSQYLPELFIYSGGRPEGASGGAGIWMRER